SPPELPPTPNPLPQLLVSSLPSRDETFRAARSRPCQPDQRWQNPPVGRVPFGLIVAVGVTAAAGAAFADSAEPPYAKRLQILGALAARYPGRVERGSAIGKYGLWAGIVVQTAWQKNSGRDRILLWSEMNRHLSVEPSTYAALLEHVGSDGHPRWECASNRAA